MAREWQRLTRWLAAGLVVAGVAALVPARWWRFAWLPLTWLTRHWPGTVLIVLGLAGSALVGVLRWRSARQAGRGQRRAAPIAVRLPLLVHVLLLLALATAVAVVVGLGLWWVLGRPGTGAVGGWSTQDTFDALKIALSVVAGVGAVVALTVAYRKQVLSEAAEYREDTKLFTERFTTAAGQLGADQAAVRLAGMYAMARLADDWVAERQTCIDVICAYLRMPYAPPDQRPVIEPSPPGGPANTGPATGGPPTAAAAGAGAAEPQLAVPPRQRGEARQEALAASQERQVRHTAIRLVAAHLRFGADTSWQGHRFDFTGAVFDGGDFSRIYLITGTEMSFDEATFAAGTVGFGRAVLLGGAVTMVGAKVIGGEIDFSRSEFDGGAVYFGDTDLRDGALHFDQAQFSGGALDFGNARCGGCAIHFDEATLTADAQVTFHGAVFTAGEVSFDGVRFAEGRCNFHGAQFSGTAVTFRGAQFCGGTVDFAAGTVHFGGNDLPFEGVESYPAAVFSAGTLDFDRAEFTAGTVDFHDAQFTGATLDLARVTAWHAPPRFAAADNTPYAGLLLPPSAVHTH
jgi:hypothetical protein